MLKETMGCPGPLPWAQRFPGPALCSLASFRGFRERSPEWRGCGYPATLQGRISVSCFLWRQEKDKCSPWHSGRREGEALTHLRGAMGGAETKQTQHCVSGWEGVDTFSA